VPQKKAVAKSSPNCVLPDWENLDDESTCCLESTDETVSMTSCASEDYSLLDHSDASVGS
jgi:hypothetical protein